MPNFEQAGNYEYDPKDYLDHGAFAVVYRGRHRINKKHIVAIKVISKKKLVKSQSLLEKEIKILKELTAVHHENIVALLEFNDVNGNVNLIMEYCNGGNLSDYLNRCGTLSEDTIRIFLSQLANAMQAMNAKGVVHRDLKPQNILLSHKDNVNIKQIPPSEIKLKVADFGFARILQDGVMAATLCGSPMYMAPEVIMSLQYDAKADLWSLGTIVFQCLTGIAPFQAQTPQALKAFYETNANLSPKLPAGTSSELRELLTGLLRRNAAERIDFTTFFNHPFLHRSEAPKPTSPLTAKGWIVVDLPPSLGNLHVGSPSKGMENQGHIPHSPPTPIPTNMSPIRSDTPNSATGTASSSPEMTDDFVLVPANLPVDHSSSSAQNTEKPFSKAATPLLMRQMSAPTTCGPSANPNSPTPSAAVRPGSLPMTEPIPVPRMRAAYMRMRSRENPNEAMPPQSAPADTNRMHGIHENNSSPVPRSQPISMRRAERSSQPDISSLSPPSVQFTLGTPPNSYGGRRRSSSGSFSETPPPPSLWQVSPGAAGKLTPTSSPLRRSGTSSPILSGQMTTVMHMGSPTSNAALLSTENNNVRHANLFPFGTRAMTLPDISEAGSFHNMYEMEADFEHDPLNFEPPELPEETLLEREHNETLAKLNFVLTLSDCVLKIAAQRGSPLSLGTGNDCVAVDNKTSGTEIVGLDAHTIKRFEQMVLLVRALQLLGSGLHLANEQLKSGQLRPSTTVRKVVSTLNKKFRSTLTDCRKINGNNLLQRAEQAKITADKILYNHAIQMCQHAALDELFGSPEDCFKQYQTAQILLHSLAHQISHQHDRNILSKYKEAVEKRLYLLQQRGYVIATDQT